MLRRKLAAMAWNGSAYFLKGAGLCRESVVLPARSSSHDLYRLSNRASHGLPFEGGSMNARISSMPRSRFRPMRIIAARRSDSGSGPGDEEDGSHIEEKRKPSKRSGGDKLAGVQIDEKQKVLERQKALEAAMAGINKDFGGGATFGHGRDNDAFKIEKVPSGCLSLDLALGGGLPKGRVIEIFGLESSGKTTLALHAIAEVQKRGGNAMLVDAEFAFAPEYSKRLGVNVDNLVILQPDHGEMALESVDRVIRSGAMDIVVIDSVSALQPRNEYDGEIGMQQMGSQARMMSSAVRKIAGNASKCNCTVIFLNQIRYKVGVVYGNPETTSGGMALKFYTSVRIEVRPGQKFKSPKGDEDIGFRGRGKVVKSKVSIPYKQFEFDMVFGEGISQLGCLVDCAESLGVIIKKGSWYSCGEERLGQGRDNVLQFFRENPERMDEVEKAVRAKIADMSPDHRSLDNDDEEMPSELEQVLRHSA